MPRKKEGEEAATGAKPARKPRTPRSRKAATPKAPVAPAVPPEAAPLPPVEESQRPTRREADLFALFTPCTLHRVLEVPGRTSVYIIDEAGPGGGVILAAVGATRRIAIESATLRFQRDADS